VSPLLLSNFAEHMLALEVSAVVLPQPTSFNHQCMLPTKASSSVI